MGFLLLCFDLGNKSTFNVDDNSPLFLFTLAILQFSFIDLEFIHGIHNLLNVVDFLEFLTNELAPYDLNSLLLFVVLVVIYF